MNKTIYQEDICCLQTRQIISEMFSMKKYIYSLYTHTSIYTSM